MQTTSRLKEIQLNEQVDLVISIPVYHKIKHLCQRIAKVEWSGVLFYKINGSIADIDSFSVEIADILLMDKGTSAFTSYTFDEDVAAHIMNKAMEDPSWMNIKIGHIHSHNTMNVFFSGTDQSELHDNAPNHNFYLSLIVNNYMEMTAKIAFVGKGQVIQVPDAYEAKDENGVEYTITMGEPRSVIIPGALFIHDCSIIKPEQEIIVSDDFRERTDLIIQRAANRPAQTGFMGGSTYSKTNTPQGTPKMSTPPSYNQPGQQRPMGQLMSHEAHLMNKEHGFPPFDDNKDETDLNDLTGLDEEFICYVLRKGQKADPADIEQAIQEVVMEDQPIETYTDHIIENLGHYYNSFFKDDTEIVMEDYTDCLATMADDLEMFEGKFPVIALLTKKLKEKIIMIESSWKKEVFK